MVFKKKHQSIVVCPVYRRYIKFNKVHTTHIISMDIRKFLLKKVSFVDAYLMF